MRHVLIAYIAKLGVFGQNWVFWTAETSAAVLLALPTSRASHELILATVTAAGSLLIAPTRAATGSGG